MKKRLQAQSDAPLLRDQYPIWLKRGLTRNQKPFRPKTAETYKSQIETNVLPTLGAYPLDAIGNKALKDLVEVLRAKNLSPATIGLNLNLIKDIRQSAQNSEGEPLYPYTWNNSFIDAPIVNKKDQDRPIASTQEVQGAIKCGMVTDKSAGCLFALLAGSGLRIKEALDLAMAYGQTTVSNWWDGEKIVVIQQRGSKTTKTQAGVREVDLAPELNQFLKKHFDLGTMFPKSESFYRKLLIACGVKGGFHSLRRFRITHLRMQGVPDALTHFWVGHGDSTVTGRYTEVGSEIESRKQQAAKAGLGFQLPEAL